MYHHITELAVEDPPKVRKPFAIRSCASDRADRDAIEAILRWLDVPARETPPERIAALRTWWRALPTPVQEAIRENITMENDGDPTDPDLVRISRITELRITEGELTDLSWVSQLEQLEDLDLEENEITDLSPLTSLTALKDLDISNNKITSLRPLAKLTRLERLVADENPLTGLEGLEQLHDLKDFHIQAGLESIEPLRGAASRRSRSTRTRSPTSPRSRIARASSRSRRSPTRSPRASPRSASCRGSRPSTPATRASSTTSRRCAPPTRSWRSSTGLPTTTRTGSRSSTPPIRRCVRGGTPPKLWKKQLAENGICAAEGA
jgi:Leucine-rich repeat (LRR) protein